MGLGHVALLFSAKIMSSALNYTNATHTTNRVENLQLGPMDPAGSRWDIYSCWIGQRPYFFCKPHLISLSDRIS